MAVLKADMTLDTDIKQQVREFYNQVGWHEVSEGVYQNARYEDLRPVSREYVHKCHLRVLRHIKPEGKYLLDAGSGPIQYPEYLQYSQGYRYRVCADISILALQEARKRIGERGLYVVADIANLPFKPDAFEGVVSLHTIHHLPFEEHRQAYQELFRVLAKGGKAVVVNGWGEASPITRLLDGLRKKLGVGDPPNKENRIQETGGEQGESLLHEGMQSQPIGTFVRKESPKWLAEEVGSRVPVRIWVWRSVNVAFLRAFIRENRGGRLILKFIYWLEERFPHFLGKYGNYPLIVMGEKR